MQGGSEQKANKGEGAERYTNPCFSANELPTTVEKRSGLHTFVRVVAEDITCQ